MKKYIIKTWEHEFGGPALSIEKIKLNEEELYDTISEICISLGMGYKIDKEKSPVQISISKDGKNSVLRIYSKKDGLKLDTTVGVNKDLNSEVEDSFKNFEVTEQKTYSYKNIDNDIYNIIKDKFHKMNSSEINIKERENRDPNKEDFFEIKNIISNEKIIISKFKNGTLMLQGVVWNLWEDICEIIDTSKDSSVEDIINRFSFGEHTEECDYREEINNIKENITEEVFDFLDEHYKDYLISAQCILNSNIKMKEFSTVLCPTAKVLEGFLKRILIELDLEKAINMTDNWHFGKVFYNKSTNRHIIYNYSVTKLLDEKEKSLFELYDAVKFYRHDLNHGSPKPKTIVREKSRAMSIYKEILDKIKTSYYKIFK